MRYIHDYDNWWQFRYIGRDEAPAKRILRRFGAHTAWRWRHHRLDLVVLSLF